jgi:hypothetical protein
MAPDTITEILNLSNSILASANVIIGFSLFVYILTHNLRSAVARAFCALTAFVTLVYVVDVTMGEVDSLASANLWLRVQWLGIAFVPAAYLHFSDALLKTSGGGSRWRSAGVWAAYAVSAGAFALVALGGLVVDGVALNRGIFHLTPGPLFRWFAAYYILISSIGWVNITRARDACLTSTSRRRMAYLMVAFIAPSVGVFPYLLIPTTGHAFSGGLVSALTLVGNVGIALMTVVIAYIVAYQGVLLPDRVVKHRLLHFLMRGPLVAILVVAIMLSFPHVPQILGLPRDTLMVVAVAGSVVTLQVMISLAKPAIDRLIYRRDRQEINWIQSLDQRLLTTTDLQQLLENTVIALCDLLRAPSGFVVTMQDDGLAIHVFSGSRAEAERFLRRFSVRELIERIGESRQDEFLANEDFVAADGHWLLPLRSRNDQSTLGLLGVRATRPVADYTDEDLEACYGLVRRAETALEDMRLQQQVFGLIQALDAELDQIQEWRSSPFSVSDAALQHLEASPVHSPGFAQAVKEALGQFWGGPKLSQSSLRRMRAVQQAMRENDNVPAKAIRAVLLQAIERLKPDGDRSLTSAEWLIYNILDLRFVQGNRIREIVGRLAVSESDYYRKQRVAIEQVAEVLAQMEQDCGEGAA